MFVNKLSGCEFESLCCHLNFKYWPVSSNEFLDILLTIECRFTLKHVRDMIIKYSQNNLMFCVFFALVVSTLLATSLCKHLFLPKKFFIKLRLSPSKKNFFICLNESTLEMIKNAFYFIVKAFLVCTVIDSLCREILC